MCLFGVEDKLCRKEALQEQDQTPWSWMTNEALWYNKQQPNISRNLLLQPNMVAPWIYYRDNTPEGDQLKD